MNRQPTAWIVRSLRSHEADSDLTVAEMCRDAADRLVELEAEIEELHHSNTRRVRDIVERGRR